jgi:hypothetical protein
MVTASGDILNYKMPGYEFMARRAQVDATKASEFVGPGVTDEQALHYLGWLLFTSPAKSRA